MFDVIGEADSGPLPEKAIVRIVPAVGTDAPAQQNISLTDITHYSLSSPVNIAMANYKKSRCSHKRTSWIYS